MKSKLVLICLIAAFMITGCGGDPKSASNPPVVGGGGGGTGGGGGDGNTGGGGSEPTEPPAVGGGSGGGDDSGGGDTGGGGGSSSPVPTPTQTRLLGAPFIAEPGQFRNDNEIDNDLIRAAESTPFARTFDGFSSHTQSSNVTRGRIEEGWLFSAEYDENGQLQFNRDRRTYDSNPIVSYKNSTKDKNVTFNRLEGTPAAGWKGVESRKDLDTGIFYEDVFTDIENAQDDDYLTLSYWLGALKDPNTGLFTKGATLGVSGGGSDPFNTNNLTGLAGRANYEGPALGLAKAKYYRAAPPAPVPPSVGSTVGNESSGGWGDDDDFFIYFNAKARLTADFGDATAPGTISGTISNFKLSDSLPGFPDFNGDLAVVRLGAAPILPNPPGSGGQGGNFRGDTTYTYDGEVTGMTGKWGGKFYGNSAVSTEHPGAVAGTFGVATNDDFEKSSVLGSFGAKFISGEETSGTPTGGGDTGGDNDNPVDTGDGNTGISPVITYDEFHKLVYKAAFPVPPSQKILFQAMKNSASTAGNPTAGVLGINADGSFESIQIGNSPPLLTNASHLLREGENKTTATGLPGRSGNWKDLFHSDAATGSTGVNLYHESSSDLDFLTFGTWINTKGHTPGKWDIETFIFTSDFASNAPFPVIAARGQAYYRGVMVLHQADFVEHVISEGIPYVSADIYQMSSRRIPAFLHADFERNQINACFGCYEKIPENVTISILAEAPLTQSGEFESTDIRAFRQSIAMKYKTFLDFPKLHYSQGTGKIPVTAGSWKGRFSPEMVEGLMSNGAAPRMVGGTLSVTLGPSGAYTYETSMVGAFAAGQQTDSHKLYK